jgi:hypothetical protein
MKVGCKLIYKNWFQIFLFIGAESCTYDENRAAPVTFWMYIEQPLSTFKFKMLI